MCFKHIRLSKNVKTQISTRTSIRPKMPCPVTYMLHLPQTRSYVPMLIPNKRAGKHNCTRPWGMNLQLHLTSSHVFISCILSACMSVTVSSYQHPCILHLHPTISHVCNNCIRPFPMSLTVASNQQSHLCKLVSKTCMSDTLATGPAFILVVAISNHLCCRLHLQQTSIVVMVVTIALDQQACANQQSR